VAGTAVADADASQRLIMRHGAIDGSEDEPAQQRLDAPRASSSASSRRLDAAKQQPAAAAPEAPAAAPEAPAAAPEAPAAEAAAEEAPEGLGLTLTTGVSSIYNWRGRNRFADNGKQNDQNALFSVGASYAFGDFSLSYWGGYQILGDNIGANIDDAVGAEQDLLLGWETELAEDLTGHHHHVICDTCGSVLDIDAPAELERGVHELAASVAATHGFVVAHHRLDLVGTCAACVSAQR
jgi:hypothetical protein